MPTPTTLTEAQKITFAQHIRANSAVAEFITNPAAVAEWYAQPNTFIVWRTSVTPVMVQEAVLWSEIVALTVGKARVWEWLTSVGMVPFDASLANVRAGLQEVFAAGTTSRTNLLAASKRPCNKLELLFVSGTGTDAVPGLLGVEIVPSWRLVAECMLLG
jgi:hypothetical protein